MICSLFSGQAPAQRRKADCRRVLANRLSVPPPIAGGRTVHFVGQPPIAPSSDCHPPSLDERAAVGRILVSVPQIRALLRFFSRGWDVLSGSSGNCGRQRGGPRIPYSRFRISRFTALQLLLRLLDTAIDHPSVLRSALHVLLQTATRYPALRLAAICEIHRVIDSVLDRRPDVLAPNFKTLCSTLTPLFVADVGHDADLTSGGSHGYPLPHCLPVIVLFDSEALGLLVLRRHRCRNRNCQILRLFTFSCTFPAGWSVCTVVHHPLPPGWQPISRQFEKPHHRHANGVHIFDGVF